MSRHPSSLLFALALVVGLVGPGLAQQQEPALPDRPFPPGQVPPPNLPPPADGGPERRKTGDLLDVARGEQLAHHVEGEQRLHAVEGDAVPELRAGQHHKPARMTEDLAFWRP